jgi:predicted DNA-binding WGR domain protein
MRHFEFSEGGSKKFWEIDQQGVDYTVRYGRIGTEGQSKTTTCASPEHAAAEVAKLVREKLKKGYQETGAAERNWRPPVAYDCGEHVKHFMNYAVARFNPDVEEGGGDGEEGIKTFPKLRDAERRAFAIHATYEDGAEKAIERFKALLADPNAPSLKALVLGNWFADVCDEPPNEFVDLIVAHADRLKGLVKLFAGDVIQEEAEISWLHQCDWAPALHALPALEEFVVRGGDGLRLERLEHHNLRSLTIQSGGLSSQTVRDVAAAKLPELRSLTLWLGTDNYGGDASIDDLGPILAGTVFPQLEFLGLMDSEKADEMAAAVAVAPILDRIKGLDLSMGTISDVGANALLQSPKVRTLKYLNLRHHYISEGVAAQLRGLGIEVNVSDRQKPDEDGGEEYRYCEVSE